MNGDTKRNYLIPLTAIFIGLPLLFWALGDFPRRTVLKESLSLLFIMSFSLMLAQFFLAQSGRSLLNNSKMSTVLKFHKAIGYIFVSILLVHPFLIVVPRYFESGVAPIEAFTIIITTFESTGVVVGMCAWGLLFVLAVTSLIRKRLPMKYKTWKIFHGILSIAFITLAAWHMIDLGRHSDYAMTIFVGILTASGIALLLRTYFSKPVTEKGIE